MQKRSTTKIALERRSAGSPSARNSLKGTRMSNRESIKSDLQRWLRRKHVLISPEFCKVVADVSSFISDIARDGFEAAFAAHSNAQSGQPFIEVAQSIAERHLRLVRGPERDVVRKSLLETYSQFAGPQSVLEPVNKTRLARSLSRPASNRKFVTALFSLHLFNIVCVGFQDELRARTLKLRSFELYMSGLDAVCWDIVTAATKHQTGKVDEKWAKAVVKSIEFQLLHSPARRGSAVRAG
jgi:hypothetical protein